MHPLCVDNSADFYSFAFRIGSRQKLNWNFILYTIEIEHHWHCTTAKFNPYLLIRLLYCGGAAVVIADAPLAGGSLLRETKFEGVHFESILHINICHRSRISLQ